MAGFASRQDVENAIAAGRFREVHFQKSNVTGSAGQTPTEYFSSTGVPGAISYSASSGVATQLTNATSGALAPLDEGNVSTQRRYLLNAQFYSNATTIAPGVIVLADLLLYYPNCAYTTPTTLDNSTTLPRYTNGKGVMCLGSHNSGTAGGGSTLTWTFTDSNSSSQSAALNITSNAKASTLSTGTGTAPFLALPAGSAGVKTLDSYTSSSSINSSVNMVLLKPLAVIPICEDKFPTEIDFLTQKLALPRIYDGACLGFFVIPGGNLASAAMISGKLQYVWG